MATGIKSKATFVNTLRPISPMAFALHVQRCFTLDYSKTNEKEKKRDALDFLRFLSLRGREK